MNSIPETPTRFDAILGQEAALRGLRERIERNHIPPALLFEGPQGIGKASTAHVVAATLLCQAPSPQGACNICPSCLKLRARSHADFHAIVPNEKNNIQIEPVRAVERVLRLRAMEGRRKIVLIDDAHRMGTPVQNGLLKTLEEPPAETHLILITHRPTALLPTIHSRCQRVRFSSLQTPLVRKVLQRALPKLSPSQHQILANLAEGAPGRALTLNIESVFELRDRVEALDSQVEKNSARGVMVALEQSSQLSKNRAELIALIEAWTIWTRDQTLMAAGCDNTTIVHNDRLEQLEALADSRGLDETLFRMEVLLEARRQLELPFNLNAQMIVEQLLLTLLGQLSPRRSSNRKNRLN